MKSPFESRAAFMAQAEIDVLGGLIIKAIDIFMVASMPVFLTGQIETYRNMQRVLHEYLSKTIPQIISAKKYMEIDTTKDEWLLKKLETMIKDKMPEYTLEDILKEFGEK